MPQVALDPDTTDSLSFSPTPPPIHRGTDPKFPVPVSTAAKLYRGLGTTRPSRLTPPTLPEGVASVAEIREPWFAIHTRIDVRGRTCDFALAWQLHLADLAYYHPQAETFISESRGEKRERRKKVVSLFGGYVFGAGERTEKYCRENREMVESILIEPRVGMIAADLLTIEAGLRKNPRMKTTDIHVGIKVRVIRGVFKGREGTVDDLKPHHGTIAVYLTIESMGRALSLELDISDLERA